MSNQTEHFDIDLQNKIFALMVQNRSFLARVYPFMQPFYFDSELLVDLVRITKEYYLNYGTNPTPLSLATETKIFLLTNKRKDVTKYFDSIENAFADKLIEQSYIEKHVFDFVKWQEVKLALYNSAELLENKKLNEIKKLMDKAFSISEVNKPVQRYASPEVIRARYSKEVFQGGVATGFTDIDAHLDNGALGAGELGLIVGFTNIGKSIVLMMLGANGLRQREKVLHITLENSKIKTELRYDRNLMGKTKSMLYDNVKGLEDFVLTMFKAHKCDLVVEHFPTSTLSVSELRSYILSLKLEDFVPTYLIVDYLKIMKHEVNYEREDQKIGDSAKKLRGLLGELGIPGWSAAQTVSSAEHKKVVAVSDIGSSFAQAQDADVALYLNRTVEEEQNKELRIVIGKNRDEAAGISIKYKYNWDIMRMFPDRS